MNDEWRGIPTQSTPRCGDSESLARRARLHVLQMVYQASASHVGACFSVADILAVLYSKILHINADQPEHPDRDRFILSKGHAAAVLYAILAEQGFFSRAWLVKFCCDHSFLAGHTTHKGVPGVEVSTGALGHGLSLGCGMALAGRSAARPYAVFVALSDGELNEGSIWEAAMFAGYHGLSNLTAIIDANGLQGFGAVRDVLDLEPLVEKWVASGWSATELDGHDHQALSHALRQARAQNDRPSVIIARTVKGKGVSFMENKLEWHYRSPNEAQLASARADLESAS